MKNAFKMTAAGAGALAFGLVSASDITAAEPDGIHDDRVVKHVIILADVSSSLTDEYDHAREGFRDYLENEAELDFNSGNCIAFTFVHFALGRHVSDTQIACNADMGKGGDGKKVLDMYMDREVISPGPVGDYDDMGYNAVKQIRLLHGENEVVTLTDGTYVYNAMLEAEKVFKANADRAASESRTVVLIGDWIDYRDHTNAEDLTRKLAENFGARVCPISVHAPGTTAPEYHYVATPEHIESNVKVDFGGKEYPLTVSPCPVQEARTPEDIGVAISAAISGMRF